MTRSGLAAATDLKVTTRAAERKRSAEDKVELRRWPRKNDADSIRARQEEVAQRLDGAREVLEHDLEPFARATEALTGGWLRTRAAYGFFPATAAGDVAVLLLLRPLDARRLVVDHPHDVGCRLVGGAKDEVRSAK